MSKDLNDFFRETSIYLTKEDPSPDSLACPTVDVFVEIAKAVQAIQGNILDLGQGPTVIFSSGPQESTLELGKLGLFTYPSDNEALTRVCARLTVLAKSDRFINAILGHWPA